MLLTVITVVSAAVAALVCAAAGAFASLAWLWAAPLTFVCCWALLALLAFGFLCLMAHLVDPDVPQEHDSKFYRFLVTLYLHALVKLTLLRVTHRGLEKVPKQGRFMLVCNHLHLADPAILLAYLPKSQLAFISKQENRDMFIVGKMMHRIMCQTLDRENDRAALKTILRCIQLIKDDEVSIGVFPEGYTSPDGKLHGFRSGVFKIAQKANVPIVVCTIRNSRALFHNFVRLKPTHVELRVLDVIPPEDLKGRTAVDIGNQVHDMMARDLGQELVAES